MGVNEGTQGLYTQGLLYYHSHRVINRPAVKTAGTLKAGEEYSVKVSQSLVDSCKAPTGINEEEELLPVILLEIFTLQPTRQLNDSGF